MNGADSDPPVLVDEEVEDIIGGLLAGGDKVTVTYDDGGDSLAIDTSALDKEEVEDAIDGLIGTDSNLTLDYDDAAGTLTIGLDSNISANAIDAASVSASEQIGNATYATLGDVPTTLPEGSQVYVQDEDRIYVEDGT